MRWRPKRFNPPKSKRARERAAEKALGVRNMTILIIKKIWGDDGLYEPPAWAKSAHKFGWMTTAEFYEIDWIKVGPSFLEMVYENSPFLKMLPKDA